MGEWRYVGLGFKDRSVRWVKTYLKGLIIREGEKQSLWAQNRD